MLPLQLFAQIAGKVIKVADGDTFTMLTSDNKPIRIRLHGIDVPERGQPFAQQAKNFVSAFTFGKVVNVTQVDIDRYGRVVAVVYLPAGNILNEELLKAGYAWHFKRYDNNKSWGALEHAAKNAKRGLWAENYPIAPWIWRRQK